MLELASQDFSQFLASEKLVLVNVYVPWCGYCQILSPILENTAQQAFDENLPVRIIARVMKVVRVNFSTR